MPVRVGQVSGSIANHESEDSHCWRKKLQLRTGDARKELTVLDQNGRSRDDYI